MSRTCIYLGIYDHAVSNGTCRESLDIAYQCVANEILKTPMMDAVGRSFARLAKKTHDAHHVNLYSLKNYRASLICSVPEITIPLFSL